MNLSRLIYSGLISLLAFSWLAGTAQQGNAQDVSTGQYVYKKATCKAVVVFHGQELAGRMIFKQVSEDSLLVAFFNELGMSYVEGTLIVRSRESGVGSRESGVGSRESGVGSRDSANGEPQTANRFDFAKLAPFLEYKSFRKYFEKGLLEMLFDKTSGTLVLPEYSGGREVEMVYKHGRKFIMKCYF
jgi:hypothetical protein